MGLFIWKVGNPLANACDDATGSVPLTGVAFDFSDLGSVGTYVVLPNGFSNDGGRSALMTMFRWGPDGGFPADGGLSVLSSGTITLTQVGSQFVGSFSVTLHEFFTGADAGELAGPFSAPFCP